MKTLKGGKNKMVRNPLKRSEPEQKESEESKQNQNNKQDVQIMEREINLSLINDKLNYLSGIIHKIAEACEVDLN
jgi:hypothetical protein